MLSWVGKRPLREVRAFPSQLVERFAPETPAGIVAEDVDWSDWPERFDRGGLLFHGDNKLDGPRNRSTSARMIYARSLVPNPVHVDQYA